MAKNRTYTMHLDVPLTEDEVLVKSRSLAKAHADLVASEGAAKLAADGHKKTQKQLKQLMADLSHEISTGKESRPVICREVGNHEKGTVSIIRTDTGETVDHRPMSTDERQTTLSILDGADEPDPETGEVKPLRAPRKRNTPDA